MKYLKLFSGFSINAFIALALLSCRPQLEQSSSLCDKLEPKGARKTIKTLAVIASDNIEHSYIYDEHCPKRIFYIEKGQTSEANKAAISDALYNGRRNEDTRLSEIDILLSGIIYRSDDGFHLEIDSAVPSL